MKHWIGIDPGASGAMCILYEDNTMELFDFKKGGIPLYVKEIMNEDTVMIGLEKVNAMPGQGVKSMFSFGERYGELQGMLQTLELGYVLVRPTEWQKACKVKPKSGKKGIHSVISKIYPKAELVGPRGGIIDGRCDALSIAHYLRGKYQ